MKAGPPFAERTLADLLNAFAANTPVPGGGSAAALAGAAGVALLMMVAGLPKTRTGAATESAALRAAAVRLRLLRDALTTLIDRDADAYSSVMTALRLPKADQAQAAVRRHAFESAMRGATEAPLDTMRACRQALGEAIIVAAQGAASAASDVGVAIELLRAAVRGAAMNVDANLSSLKAAPEVDRARAARSQLAAESAADAERGLALLADALPGADRP